MLSADLKLPPNFHQRWEDTYGMNLDIATKMEEDIAAALPRAPYYPTRQLISTIHFRNLRGDREKKLRIRSYPQSEGAPAFLERKEKEWINGQCKAQKERMISPANFWQGLLAGSIAADLLHPAESERGVAARAQVLIDEEGIRPVSHLQYKRTAYENEEGTVRITFDTDIHYQGLGELRGQGMIEGAICDVKIVGDTPAWLEAIVAKYRPHLTFLINGKGSTSINRLEELAA